METPALHWSSRRGPSVGGGRPCEIRPGARYRRPRRGTGRQPSNVLEHLSGYGNSVSLPRAKRGRQTQADPYRAYRRLAGARIDARIIDKDICEGPVVFAPRLRSGSPDILPILMTRVSVDASSWMGAVAPTRRHTRHTCPRCPGLGRHPRCFWRLERV